MFDLFLGVLVSSLASLLFWSFSTLFQPSSATLFNNIVKVLLSSVFPILLLCLMFFLHYIKGIKFILPKFSFITGFLYWNLIFTILSNTRRDSDLATITLPIVFMIILLGFYYLNKFTFPKRDRVYKSIIYMIMPILLVFTKVFSYYSMVALIILFLVLIAISFTVKSKYKIILNNLINLK